MSERLGNYSLITRLGRSSPRADRELIGHCTLAMWHPMQR